MNISKQDFIKAIIDAYIAEIDCEEISQHLCEKYDNVFVSPQDVAKLYKEIDIIQGEANA